MDFLNAWEKEDYASMYAMLTSASQVSISEEDFTKTYRDTAIESTLTGLETELIEESAGHQQAEIGYRVKMQTSLVGEIIREMKMKLEQVNGQWKVQWDPGMILPELAGGNYLKMDLEIPSRGNINDRNGNTLAHQIEAAAIGVWPDFVDLTDDQYIKGLIPLLSGLSGVRTDTLLTMIEEAQPGAYLALGEIPADQDAVKADADSLAATVDRFYVEGKIDNKGISNSLLQKLEQAKKQIAKGSHAPGFPGASRRERLQPGGQLPHAPHQARQLLIQKPLDAGGFQQVIEVLRQIGAGKGAQKTLQPQLLPVRVVSFVPGRHRQGRLGDEGPLEGNDQLVQKKIIRLLLKQGELRRHNDGGGIRGYRRANGQLQLPAAQAAQVGQQPARGLGKAKA